MKTLLSSLALVALSSHVAMAAIPAAAPVELVTNGSFEDTLQANGTWGTYADLPGWYGTANGIELRDNVAGQALDGDNFVELDTFANSSMQQFLATTAGTHYTLSFAYSPRPGVGGNDPTTNDINVYWNGGILAALNGVNTGSANTWTTYTFNVVGQSTSNLTFEAAGTSDSLGGALDMVSVRAVPEPETYALMIAGLAALGFVARRRKAAR